MSTHSLCFDQKYEKYQSFLSENFQFLVMKFSIYLNSRAFVMKNKMEILYKIMAYMSLRYNQSNLKIQNMNALIIIGLQCLVDISL